MSAKKSIFPAFNRPSPRGRGGEGVSSRNWRMLPIFLALLFPSSPALAAQNLGGDTGLIKIPTADVIQDGDLAFNFAWIGGTKGYLQRPKINRLYTATVGILPNLEVCFRATQVIGWHDPQVYIENAADRMVSLKYRFPIWRDGSLALGINDLFSINALNVPGEAHERTQYGQHTLYLAFSQGEGPIHLHCGYGQSESAINGLFAGIEVYPVSWVHLLADYDSHDFNVGAQMSLFDVLNLGAYWLGEEDYAYSAALRFHL